MLNSPKHRYSPYFLVIVLVGAESVGEDRGYLEISKRGDEIVFSGEAAWLTAQVDPRSHFHNLPGLRRLTLVRHDVSVQELKYIATLTRVVALDVGSVTWGLKEDEVSVSGEGLSQIGNMVWLEELEINASGLGEEGWSFLTNCNALRSLRIGRDVPVTDSFFEQVANCQSLEILEIRGTNRSFSDSALVHVAKLGNLKVLRLSSTRLTDNGVESLGQLVNLEMLNVYGPLTAKSLDHARPLRNLRHLGLSIKSAPAPAMAIVASFANLETLDLASAELGDAELAELRGHRSLRRLYLNNTKVTARSLEMLESIKSLEHVSLSDDVASRHVERALNARLRMKPKDDAAESHFK